jgi:phosphoribosylanthranilate isomerase
MNLFVKICGVSDEAGLAAAVEAGADAVGFVFHAASPRNLAPGRAAALAARLPGGVLAVAVTCHPSQGDVDRVLEAFHPDAWQSDAPDFDAIRLPPTVRRLPVLRGPAAQAPAGGRVLFDAPESGRGARADWHAASELARRTQLILGGGLDAANVAAAMAAVRPFGVDVSSGVESAPGLKDPARIRAFVSAARAGVLA